MPQKAQYSEKYGYNISSINFGCGGETPSNVSHGTLTTDGINGAQPKKFTHDRSRGEPRQPTPETFNHTEGRSVFRPPAEPRNPLAPEYKYLPQKQEAPVEPPKFIRDTLDVSDIPGSNNRAEKQATKPNPSLITEDIEGSRPGWRPPRLQGPSFRGDTQLDVSDIAQKKKVPRARKKAGEGGFTPVLADGIGRRRDAEWQKERNASLRQQGQELSKARQAAGALVENVPPEAAHQQATALGLEFRAVDKNKSGLLAPKDFEAALQRSGIEVPSGKVKEITQSLAIADGSGLVPYKGLLAGLYDKSLEAGASNVTDAPQWYISRRHRRDDDVSRAIRLQPPTKGSKEKAPKPGGKKISGLTKAGGEETRAESYWFADVQSEDAVSGAEKGGAAGENAHQSGEGSKEHLDHESLWFSKNGEDKATKEALAKWRPTKDAAIAFDVRKQMRKQKAGEEAQGEGQLPPPKPPVVSQKAPAPSRKVQHMAEKDVELVRQLD